MLETVSSPFNKFKRLSTECLEYVVPSVLLLKDVELFILFMFKIALFLVVSKLTNRMA